MAASCHSQCCRMLLATRHQEKGLGCCRAVEDRGHRTPLAIFDTGSTQGKSLVANALHRFGFRQGDAIAVDMPMTVHAVIIYLAIVLSGCVVVSIADSFAAPEIATRLTISNAKGIFTQDVIVRGAKALPLYS
eukprot:TRINITY_DN314_c0_g1_i1.p3 TRINITY_DN314_c0_g1~~TRINITY_DN314_c0_g1_i1.p3  ORF type:complete len:133 (+),score=19.06 TRINITY_DN314_c0_g1_i1:415-813(+)